MNRGVLGLVAMQRIEARHKTATTTLSGGGHLSSHEIGVLLTEMARLIASHHTATRRLAAVEFALDGRTGHPDMLP